MNYYNQPSYGYQNPTTYQPSYGYQNQYSYSTVSERSFFNLPKLVNTEVSLLLVMFVLVVLVAIISRFNSNHILVSKIANPKV